MRFVSQRTPLDRKPSLRSIRYDPTVKLSPSILFACVEEVEALIFHCIAGLKRQVHSFICNSLLGQTKHDEISIRVGTADEVKNEKKNSIA